MTDARRPWHSGRDLALLVTAVVVVWVGLSTVTPGDHTSTPCRSTCDATDLEGSASAEPRHSDQRVAALPGDSAQDASDDDDDDDGDTDEGMMALPAARTILVSVDAYTRVPADPKLVSIYYLGTDGPALRGPPRTLPSRVDSFDSDRLARTSHRSESAALLRGTPRSSSKSNDDIDVDVDDDDDSDDDDQDAGPAHLNGSGLAPGRSGHSLAVADGAFVTGSQFAAANFSLRAPPQ